MKALSYGHGGRSTYGVLLGGVVYEGGGAGQYLPVIPAPDKTICVGVNYRPHAEEMRWATASAA